MEKESKSQEQVAEEINQQLQEVAKSVAPLLQLVIIAEEAIGGFLKTLGQRDKNGKKIFKLTVHKGEGANALDDETVEMLVKMANTRIEELIKANQALAAKKMQIETQLHMVSDSIQKSNSKEESKEKLTEVGTHEEKPKEKATVH